jgi:hypothetical protein
MSAPLTPPGCDLRDFPRMMIDIVRLRGSGFDAIINDSAWRAGFNLWFASWHQVPAASLPNVEAELAKAAELGKDLRTWRKLRAEALRGWVLCDDGRLYHTTVAEFALEAWLEKLVQALSSGAGNAKQWKVEFDAAPIEADIDAAATMLAALNPKSKALTKLKRRRARGKPAREPDETPDGSPDGTPAGSPSGSQETGTETEIGNGGGGVREDAPPDDWPAGKATDHARLLVEQVASSWLDPSKAPGLVLTEGRLAVWKREGASWEHDVVPVVTALSTGKHGLIATWKFFDPAIGRSIAANRQALEIPEVRPHDDSTRQNPRNTRAARRGVWAEVLAEERGEGACDPAGTR